MITFELLSPGKYLPGDYFLQQAPGTSRTEIEIGPGDGRFLFESARAVPDAAMVGLEIRAGWANDLVEHPKRPANALPYHADGRWLTIHLFETASVDAFHIYFPDPWWKKRHHKRRLVTDEMASALRRCLKPDGSIFVITDVPPLYQAIEAELLAAELKRHTWERRPEDPAQSSYERKYRRQGRRLYQGRFTRD